MGASLEQHLQTTRDTATAVQTLQTDVREMNTKLDDHEGRLQSLETKACPASGGNFHEGTATGTATTSRQVQRTSGAAPRKRKQPSSTSSVYGDLTGEELQWLEKQREAQRENAGSDIMKWSWDTGSVQVNWTTRGHRTHMLNETLGYPEYRADVMIRDKYKAHRALEGGKAATEDATFARAAKLTGVAVGAATSAAVNSTASSMATVGVDVVFPDGLHISAGAGAAGASTAHSVASTSVEWAIGAGLDQKVDDVYTSPSHLQGFGCLLFKIKAPVHVLFDIRYAIELMLRDTLQSVGICDNSDKDRSAGRVPDTSACQTVFAGVYAVGRGPQGTHAKLSETETTMTISTSSVRDCEQKCKGRIDTFVKKLVDLGGSAKAGASSLGTKSDGTTFDTTKGRWACHLGNYYKIPKL